MLSKPFARLARSDAYARFARAWNGPPSTRRQFWLENEAAPEPVPGRWEPRRDDALQKSPAGTVRPPLVMVQQETPPGPVTITFDNSTAPYEPLSPEGIAYWRGRWEQAHRPTDAGPGAHLGPTPLADELRRDRELLEAANGRLVARVRVLEGQLRAAGIEPAARE